MNFPYFINKYKKTTMVATLGLSFALTFGIRDFIEHNKITYDLIGKALYKASGEDGMLSTEEKVRFLKELGLEYAVQDGQKLLLEKSGEFANVYLDSSYVGTLHREGLKKYISNDLKL